MPKRGERLHLEAIDHAAHAAMLARRTYDPRPESRFDADRYRLRRVSREFSEHGGGSPSG
jgi:hypothetical protein